MTVAPKLQPERHAYWPDERLVAECRKGSEQAWAALVDKYKNLIYSIPVKLGMYDEAADIFQAVCLDLLSDLPKLREPRALPKWLMQTCYRKCLQYRRKGASLVPLAGDGSDDVPADADQSPLPEDLLGQLQKEQALRDALAQLNSRCERMVRMLFFECPPRPYQEIARDLGLATGSIGFIRGRCLEKLRKRLEEMGF
ncbi:MAG TPA: sigma-70 family RNA polymerase sigma factor [Terriglobales bacterium]|nr:sigma-70 family RNA polymerase sigma factor [Terriglobales bacterium]